MVACIYVSEYTYECSGEIVRGITICKCKSMYNGFAKRNDKLNKEPKKFVYKITLRILNSAQSNSSAPFVLNLLLNWIIFYYRWLNKINIGLYALKLTWVKAGWDFKHNFDRGIPMVWTTISAYGKARIWIVPTKENSTIYYEYKLMCLAHLLILKIDKFFIFQQNNTAIHI